MSWAALGGALLGASLSPAPGAWPLGWIGLAPLFYAANRASPRRAAGLGYAAGFAFHAVAFHWIYATCRFAQIPAAAAALVWVALAAFLALPWALFGALGRWLTEEKARGLRPWVWALAWTALAAAGERWTPRLPGDLLAHTQWPNLALLQAGAWAGPHLLGFVVALVNAALAEAWTDSREPGPGAAAGPLACGLGLAALLWLHGNWTLLRRPEPVPGPVAAILHPAVDQYEKWDRGRQARVLARIEELARRDCAPPPALVIWPETSLPRWGAPEGVPAEPAASWAREDGAAHLVGLVAHAPDGAHNAAQLVAADGSLAGVYRKRELVPFGEYIPFRALIPARLAERFDALERLEDMAPGAAEQPLLETPWGRAAVTICYEAAFPRWARRDAARGARVIVNITNDGWYKGTWQASQHLQVNVQRAIETRSWLLRSANGGVSAVVSPWGELVASRAEDSPGRLLVAVPAETSFPRGSWYVRGGDWAAALALLLTAALALGRAFTSRRG